MNQNRPKVDVNQKPLPVTPPPFFIGTIRQVLFDGFFISMGDRFHWDQLPYGINFSLGKLEKHGSPIMEYDTPGEDSTAWFNLLKEGPLYRMWYQSSHTDGIGGRVSYAESDDGIQWNKPNLGLFEVNDSKDNNVVFDGGFNRVGPEFGAVFRDPNAEPGEEYKMTYAEWHGQFIKDLPDFSPSNGTLRGASSPDGFKWTRYYENFIDHYTDSQNVGCWDPTLEQYVIYHRSFISYGGLHAGSLHVKEQRGNSYPGFGRALGRMESENFRVWSHSQICVAADLDDGLNTDIYSNAYSRHPDNVNAHYLFPSFYRHYEGTFEVQVCTSRDNRNWARPCRDTFIPLGNSGEFDCFVISVAPGFVPVDDDTWALYYRSGDGPHGGSHPITLDYKPKSRLGRVTFKRDRVVGIEGAPEGGHFSTRPLSFNGGRLVINAEPTGPDPEIRIQILSSDTNESIEGYTFEKCKAITTDGSNTLVEWEGKNGIGEEVSRESVRLHFKIRSMRIYAFQFLP